MYLLDKVAFRASASIVDPTPRPAIPEELLEEELEEELELLDELELLEELEELLEELELELEELELEELELDELEELLDEVMPEDPPGPPQATSAPAVRHSRLYRSMLSALLL